MPHRDSLTGPCVSPHPDYTDATKKIEFSHETSQAPTVKRDCTLPHCTQPYQTRKIGRLPSSPSFVPGTPCSVQTEYAPSQMRRPSTEDGVPHISPFRSVRRMKKPFELMLPTSPKSQSAKERKSSSASFGGKTLRPWRSDQNLAATRLETLGLLPSPPLSASSTSSCFHTSAYLLSNGDPTSVGSERLKECGSVLVHQAGRSCDSWSSSTLEGSDGDGDSSGENGDSLLPMQAHVEDTAATSAPIIDEEDAGDTDSLPQRTRDDTVSSEASWIPNDLSYFENWLQGVPGESMDFQDDDSKNGFANRRKCQIVQKLPPLFDDTLSETLKFAVASKVKPRLVNISPKLSPSTSHVDEGQSPKPQTPLTPNQYEQEISAFSPDTENEEPQSLYDIHYSYDSGRERDVSGGYTDIPSMRSDRSSSTAACEQPVWSHDSDSRDFSYPLVKLDFSPMGTPMQNFQPVKMSEDISEREKLEKWWDHEWTLDQLEHSTSNFPGNMLRLTSPVIMFLRQNKEQALLRPYRQIFPEASENLLDSLCANAIARNYIMSLSSSQRDVDLPPTSSTYGFGIVPNKAMSTLGIQVPRVSPTHMRDRTFGSRGAELKVSLDRIVDYLLFAICGRSDEILKSAVLVLAETLEAKV